MFTVQIVSLAAAGATAFFLSRSGIAIWRPIAGAIVGLPVGFFAGVLIGALLGDPTDFRIYTTSFWFGLFGIVGGVIYGRKKLKAAQTAGDLKH